MAELATSLAELLGPDAQRTPMAQTAGVSGASFERVARPDGDFVLKRLDRRHDWTMRAMGDVHGVTRHLWERGILDALPGCIDQPIVGVAVEQPAAGTGVGDTTWLLMRDVGPWLVPDADDPLPLGVHRTFVAHMAAVHAAFWDGTPTAAAFDLELTPVVNRLLDLSPWLATTEAAIGSAAVIPRLVGEGWARFPEVARSDVAPLVRDLACDPTPIAAALASTPGTLVHGNWKYGNLGTTPDGRTILLDWEGTAHTAALLDLSWYLAINCRRIPEPKEAAIAFYRTALESAGVDTGGWWDRQLAVALLTGLVWFGWEKALAGARDDELAWWEDRVLEGVAWL